MPLSLQRVVTGFTPIEMKVMPMMQDIIVDVFWFIFTADEMRTVSSRGKACDYVLILDNRHEACRANKDDE